MSRRPGALYSGGRYKALCSSVNVAGLPTNGLDVLADLVSCAASSSSPPTAIGLAASPTVVRVACAQPVLCGEDVNGVFAWGVRAGAREEDGKDQATLQTLLRRRSTLSPEQPGISVGVQRYLSSLLSATCVAAVSRPHSTSYSTTQLPKPASSGSLLSWHNTLRFAYSHEDTTGPMALFAAHALLHAPIDGQLPQGVVEMLDPFLPDALRTASQNDSLLGQQRGGNSNGNPLLISSATATWRSLHRFANAKGCKSKQRMPTTGAHLGPVAHNTTSVDTPNNTLVSSRLLETVAWKMHKDARRETPAAAASSSQSAASTAKFSIEYLDDMCNRICTRRDGSAVAVGVMPLLRQLTKVALEAMLTSNPCIDLEGVSPTSPISAAIPAWLGLCCMTLVTRSFQNGDVGRTQMLSESVEASLTSATTASGAGANSNNSSDLLDVLMGIRNPTPAPLQSYFHDEVISAVFGEFEREGGQPQGRPNQSTSQVKDIRLRQHIEGVLTAAMLQSPSFATWVHSTLVLMTLSSHSCVDGARVASLDDDGLTVLCDALEVVSGDSQRFPLSGSSSSSSTPLLDVLTKIINPKSVALHRHHHCDTSEGTTTARRFGVALAKRISVISTASQPFEGVSLNLHPSQPHLPSILELTMSRLGSDDNGVVREFVAGYLSGGGDISVAMRLPDDKAAVVLKTAFEVSSSRRQTEFPPAASAQSPATEARGIAIAVADHAAAVMKEISSSTFRLTGERKKRTDKAAETTTVGPLPAYRVAAYLPPVFCSSEMFSSTLNELTAALTLDMVATGSAYSSTLTSLTSFLAAASADGLAASCVPTEASLEDVMAVPTPSSSPIVTDSASQRRSRAHAIVASLENCCVGLCASQALLRKMGDQFASPLVSDQEQEQRLIDALRAATVLLTGLVSRWGARTTPAVASRSAGGGKQSSSAKGAGTNVRTHKQELLRPEFPALRLARLSSMLTSAPDFASRRFGVELANSLLAHNRIVSSHWSPQAVEQIYQLTKLFSLPATSPPKHSSATTAGGKAGQAGEMDEHLSSQLDTWRRLYLATKEAGAASSRADGGGVVAHGMSAFEERLLAQSALHIHRHHELALNSAIGAGSASRANTSTSVQSALAAATQVLFPVAYKQAVATVLTSGASGFAASVAKIETKVDGGDGGPQYFRQATEVNSTTHLATTSDNISLDVALQQHNIVPFLYRDVSSHHYHHHAMEHALILGPTAATLPHVRSQEIEARKAFWGQFAMMGGVGGGGLFVSSSP